MCYYQHEVISRSRLFGCSSEEGASRRGGGRPSVGSGSASVQSAAETRIDCAQGGGACRLPSRVLSAERGVRCLASAAAEFNYLFAARAAGRRSVVVECAGPVRLPDPVLFYPLCNRCSK